MSKTVTGTWLYPDGTPVNGVLYLQLSQSATATGTAQISPRNLAVQLVNGSIPLNYTIWANDELSPGGTYYTLTIVAGGGTVWGPENFSITGTSPINLNTLVAVTTNFFSSSVLLQSPTLATPNITGGFTLNGSAPVGHVPRGNGTYYVDAQLNFSDLAGTFTFASLGAGTNTGQILTVGNGSSLSASGTGSIAATSILTAPFWNVLTKTANYNAIPGDLVLCDTSGGGFTVTIPAAAAGNKGMQIAVKKITSDANAATVSSASNIDGQSWTISAQYNCMVMVSDSSTWNII